MNKKGLTDFVAEATGLKKKDSKIAIDTVLEGVLAGLQADGKVTLVGFGTFELYTRKARKGHNPKTQEPLDIPEKTALKFRISKKLKEAAAAVDLSDIAAAAAE